VALTIAGSDSGGGAGIQADLRTFALHGVHGAAVLVALTAQNTRGVQGVYPVPADVVDAQLASVLDDLPVRAAKTGMLGDPAVIARIVARWSAAPRGPLVVDPVMVATSGDRLLPAAGEAALLGELLPLATLVTPNLPETVILLGRAVAKDRASREAAARELADRHGNWALVKGGHVDAADVLAGPGTVRWFEGPYIETPHTHGTGCHLSAAITARLARGASVEDAVAGAKQWLTAALAAARPWGSGRSSPWPLPDAPVVPLIDAASEESA
jgi:hydroxymethylpyrimidine/phosphomethylpyrimidine kinase